MTQVRWSPIIPGLLATGSKDQTVKVWQTHLIDSSLIIKENNNNSNNNSNNNNNMQQQYYPLHTIEFRPIAEFKTSGSVSCLKWSPDGTMLIASLKQESIVNNDNNNNNNNESNQYYLQCFDVQPVVGSFYDDAASDISIDSDKGDQRTRIFTLQDHPSFLCFSHDSTRIYMSMAIDPNSEENEKRRPAFLVYLDLTHNQLHRCKTVDRIIDHQTEFIKCMSINNNRNLLIVATSTHQNQGRVIAWDVETDETKIIERQMPSIQSMQWVENDTWLIIGRSNGSVEFWKVQMQTENNNENYDNDNDNDNNNNNNENNENYENNNHKMPEIERIYANECHGGPVFNLTVSNGVLISSAQPNLEYESYFTDNIIWDIRKMIQSDNQPKIIHSISNINGNNDITRLLDISPVTIRQVQCGGGPGSLLAASGDNHVYCHSLTGFFFFLHLTDLKKKKYNINTNTNVNNHRCYFGSYVTRVTNYKLQKNQNNCFNSFFFFLNLFIIACL